MHVQLRNHLKNGRRAGAGLLLVVIPAWIAAPLPGSRAAEPSEARPNILMLFVDQLRWCEVGCYGNRVIRTPNIDQLAAKGVRFTHAFANFPSCSPARSTLLSGRHARSNGVYANQHGNSGLRRPTNRDTTLAEALSAAGYTTALVGKWHLTPNPQALGLEDKTIVVFSSDHGDLFGSHQLYNKNQHYDEAARIPMILRHPRRFAPRVIDRQIISLVDLMPTLLDLCSVKVPASVQGTSLAPVLADRM